MTHRHSIQLIAPAATFSQEIIADTVRFLQEDEFHLPDDPDKLDDFHDEKLRQMDAIANEFQSLNDLANELIDLKVNELLLKTTDVLNETDLDYRRQVADLEAQCQRRIDSAGARLTLRLRSIRELGRANELLELLQHAKARARQEVLCNIYTELEKTLSERMLNKLSELRRAQRRAFKRRLAFGDGEVQEDTDSVTDTDSVAFRPAKRPQGVACPYIVYTLRPHEIEEDLRAIQQSFLCQPSVSTIDLYPKSDPVLQADCKEVKDVSSDLE
ncbi:uncharacterized protein LOC111261982 isoform X2 [Varroa jacobsoni]|uniref:Uncharacterized protein n=1 Tax=Varroa destructor TaxID=109461 RepID=A0A7M7M746_VARDE|nr:uncharacterized protein LOC111247627 isoform X2 [Varroa destructor]XP_022691645.1 uncharacterized protein LOC111261982 isoform X2 [Varroa jacobsoni]